MKKILLTILVIFSLVFITGCDNKEQSKINPNTNTLNHKVYKHMKISSDNAGGLINIAYIFDEPSVVGYADDYYKPCLTADFDTVTGKATSVKFYSFFLDYEGSSEWVDKSIEKFNSSTTSYKKDFSNISKGRVSEFVTYFVVDIDPKSYVFNQYIQMLFYEQDIEKYKDEVYYSRLYNYSTKPPVKEGDNYFEETLENLRIEWSDSSIKAY